MSDAKSKSAPKISKAHPTWFAFCRWFMRVFFYGWGGGFRSIGRENVPPTGPVIFAPIHLSHTDPPAVACGCTRRLRFMSKAEMFEKPFLGWLIASLGAFRVNRGEGDTESVRTAIELLNSGEAILIFPEGTRGDGKIMHPISRGVGMLAKKTNADIVPVALIGTLERLPKGSSKLRRSVITVVYGKPFRYAEICKDTSERRNREIFSHTLAEKIVELCNAHGLMVRSGETNLTPTTESHPE
jgi:1-acyl-sn-glycerol-3-phosphate acyltransferase